LQGSASCEGESDADVTETEKSAAAGTATDPSAPMQGIPYETEALKALLFYTQNYTNLMCRGLGGNKQIVLGSKPFKCRFCGGEPPNRTFKKRAHAVSELLGNKVMKSLYECDTCNERFCGFEDDLAKMTLPSRSIGGVIGKKGVPKLVAADGGSARMQLKDGELHFSHNAGDIGFVEDETNKLLTFTYVEQPYRPLAAYKALCKSAFALLPEDELVHFEHLRQWLLQPDLTTGQVYSRGGHICYSTFVPAFQPFKQPIVCLLKRNEQIDAPYMSFFIATGNSSYQIFLPCPAKDDHLLGKTITPVAFPHPFQLQPWLIPARPQERHLELSLPERTSVKSGSMSCRYEKKIKVS
jgi:hypothetical protein